MAYPSPLQYSEALQHPETALADRQLKKGRAVTNALGLPRAMSGGFALTYTVEVGSVRHAVRCFHRQSDALEKRYGAISRKLNALGSPYFVEFEFQPAGVRIDKRSYPVVKMDWADGPTLGAFLQARHGKKAEIRRLLASLHALAKELQRQGIAHGDISADNLIVTDAGRTLRLVDYDGMFVEELRPLGSSERGHLGFQHPKRNGQWDAGLDRFSFILLHVALRSLEADPSLWKDTDSGELIVFSANDLAGPSESLTFDRLCAIPAVADEARRLAAICTSPFAAIPSLSEFLAESTVRVAPVPSTTPTIALPYLSAFPVLDASDHDACRRHVGDKVELVGRIHELQRDRSPDGEQSTFLNFGPRRSRIVQLSISSRVLAKSSNAPDASWVGKWVSTTGLIEPATENSKAEYSHLTVTISDLGQVHEISELEAEYRLGRRPTGDATPSKVAAQSVPKPAAKPKSRSAAKSGSAEPKPKAEPTRARVRPPTSAAERGAGPKKFAGAPQRPPGARPDARATIVSKGSTRRAAGTPAQPQSSPATPPPAQGLPPSAWLPGQPTSPVGTVVPSRVPSSPPSSASSSPARKPVAHATPPARQAAPPHPSVATPPPPLHLLGRTSSTVTRAPSKAQAGPAAPPVTQSPQSQPSNEESSFPIGGIIGVIMIVVFIARLLANGGC